MRIVARVDADAELKHADAELKHVDAELKHVASDASEALAQAVPGASFKISITFVPYRAGGAS